jgi:hypothetical protein
METLHNKRHCNVNKKYDNKDKNDKKNKKDKKDKNTSYSTDRPMPIKVYFPTISIHKMNDILIADTKVGSTTNKTKKTNTIDISKYLVDESNKILIYGSSGIFEMIHNNLFQLYPVDKNIKEVTVNNNLKVLLDGSYMKRYDTPSYQIPYNHNIKYKTIRTYKNDVKSNIKFVIEMENESICDFYMLISSADVTNNENKKIELNNFVKDEVLSFLSRLNLYR